MRECEPIVASRSVSVDGESFDGLRTLLRCMDKQRCEVQRSTGVIGMAWL
ncbi:hypothetical protein [Muriicola sp.]